MTSPGVCRHRGSWAQRAVRHGVMVAFAAILAGLPVAASSVHAKPLPGKPAQAKSQPKSCKVLKSEFVGFGEQTSKDYANSGLDKEIAAWEAKYNRKAEPKNRKLACKVYIKSLNEFECVAEVELCR